MAALCWSSLKRYPMPKVYSMRSNLEVFHRSWNVNKQTKHREPENCTVHRIKDLDWGCKVNDNTDLGKVGARACPWSFYDVIAQMPLWIISVSYALFHSCGFRVLDKGVQLASPRTHAQGLTSRCQKWKFLVQCDFCHPWLLPSLMHGSFYPKSEGF